MLNYLICIKILNYDKPLYWCYSNVYVFVSKPECTKHTEKNHDEYGIMMITPDSLLSKEMRQTKYQIIYCFFSFTNLVEAKLVFKPDNNDESYKKLPKLYLDHILKNIDEINNCSDSTTRSLIIDSFHEMKRNTLAKLIKMKE